MADEKVVLNEAGVIVTSANVSCKGKTIALAGITSARTEEKVPSRKGPIILAAAAVLSLALRVPPQGAALLVVAAAAWWFLQKKRSVLVLATASGNEDVFASKDKALVDRIAAAVNDARGKG